MGEPNQKKPQNKNLFSVVTSSLQVCGIFLEIDNQFALKTYSQGNYKKQEKAFPNPLCLHTHLKGTQGRSIQCHVFKCLNY